MSERKTRVRLPALPAAEFFQAPEHTILSADGKALLSYDSATSSGFVYYLDTRSWSITAPVSFDAWATLAAAAGLAIPPGADAARWIRACSSLALRGSAGLH